MAYNKNSEFNKRMFKGRTPEQEEERRLQYQIYLYLFAFIGVITIVGLIVSLF